MHPAWRIEMLGTFRAINAETTVSRFRTKRVALLLAYLALHPNRFYSRDELGEMLWPDQELVVVRRNFRQVLLSLRAVLEPPPMPFGAVLQASQSRVQLVATQITTDVSEFETSIEQATRRRDIDERLEFLRRAIALRRGELLPGFTQPWLDNERYRLDDLYISALTQLGEVCAEQGKTDEAIQYLRRILAIDPLTEDWHVALMRRYLESGRASSALKQFAVLQSVLATELERDPDADAQELARHAQHLVALGNGIEDEAYSVPSPHQVHLPVQLTRMFGRAAEIRNIVTYFQEGARLVTLVGPAGTGKTRLSVEAGRQLAQSSTWNVWFIPLADIDDPALIFERILNIVAPEKQGTSDPIELIHSSVTDRPSLLILDNFEHIVQEGAALVARLLAGVESLCCLVTSRHSLRINGERQIRLDPLAIPASGASATYDTEEHLTALAEIPSVQMFIDRCQAIRSDVRLTTRNAPYYAEVCAILEGIPLAIEIAAGLTNVFSPSQMVSHLKGRLASLTNRSRDESPRHRTLRAAIEYSFEALSPELKMFFVALSVFRGGFTVEAAWAVAASDLFPVESAADDRYLSRILDLQERSFLRSEQGIQEEVPPRLRMLEVFRSFGEEHLASEERERLRKRHADYYLNDIRQTVSAEIPGEKAAYNARVEADYDNYIAALDFQFEREQIESCFHLLLALSWQWDVRGTRSIEESYVHRIAARANSETLSLEDRIQLALTQGTISLRKSDFQTAYDACKRALELALPTGKEVPITTSYYGMALCAGYMGQSEHCLELCDLVLQHEASLTGALRERTYVNKGQAYRNLGQWDEAEVAFRYAVQISRDSRNGMPDPVALAHLVGILLDRRRFDEAIALADECLRLSRELGHQIGLAVCLLQISRYHLSQKEGATALTASYEGLAVARDLAITPLSMDLIRGHALVLVEVERYEEAARLLAVTRNFVSVKNIIDEQETTEAIVQIHRHLSETAFHRAWQSGLGMSADKALRLALSARG